MHAVITTLISSDGEYSDGRGSSSYHSDYKSSDGKLSGVDAVAVMTEGGSDDKFKWGRCIGILITSDYTKQCW